MKISKGTIIQISARTFKSRVHIQNIHAFVAAWKVSSEPAPVTYADFISYMLVNNYWEELPCLQLTLNF